MQAFTQNPLKGAEAAFNIIEAFAGLSPQRKVSVCDRLFNGGREAYQTTVQMLWPKAEPQDMKKLENFLILLKNTAH